MEKTVLHAAQVATMEISLGSVLHVIVISCKCRYGMHNFCVDKFKRAKGQDYSRLHGME